MIDFRLHIFVFGPLILLMGKKNRFPFFSLNVSPKKQTVPKRTRRSSFPSFLLTGYVPKAVVISLSTPPSSDKINIRTVLPPAN